MKEMVGGCCVCSDERGWPENPLVYCDGQNCTVAVHQACYGIVTVPTGPWYCRKCESQERSARVRCELCPSKNGALKKTDNQGWAHVVCALYIPEVRFGNVTTMEPIILSLIPTERYAKACYICQESGKASRANVGACMQCNKTGCKQQFHVTCAQALGLLCEEAGNYLDNVKYCGYCQHHYSKLKKGGNVKTIPPYKPITHETNSSDATSSPEKELEPSISATTTTSVTTIKISSSQSSSSIPGSSTSSSSSSKQRKSSSTSKLVAPSSISTSSLMGSNPPSGAGTSTLTSSSTSSSSKSNPSSSSSSKEKDKHSKSLSKVSSSSKNEKESSSSSSSSSRDKTKSSKTKESSDHGTSSTSLSAITPSNSINISSSSATLQQSSLGNNKDSIVRKVSSTHITENVINSESVFGSNEQQQQTSLQQQTQQQHQQPQPPQQQIAQTSSKSSSSSSSSMNKKRKSDSIKTGSAETNEQNSSHLSFRNIIKDLSVTLVPLPMDKADLPEVDRTSKKPKSETSPPLPQPSNEPNIQNVSPNLMGSQPGVGITVKQHQSMQQSGSSLQNQSSNGSSSVPHIKAPILKDAAENSRMRSNSPYSSSTAALGNSNATTPSLYVSVPLSTATVPGVNLPSAPTNDNVTQSQLSNRGSPHINHHSLSHHHQSSSSSSSSSISQQTSILERQSPRQAQNLSTGSAPISHVQDGSALSQLPHSSSSNSSVIQPSISPVSNSTPTSLGGTTASVSTMETGTLKITYEKQNLRPAQLQDDEMPGRRSRSQSGDSSSKSRSGKKRTAGNVAVSSSTSSTPTPPVSATLPQANVVAAIPSAASSAGGDMNPNIGKNLSTHRHSESHSSQGNAMQIEGSSGGASSSNNPTPSNVLANERILRDNSPSNSHIANMSAKQLNKKMLRAQQSQYLMQQQQQMHQQATQHQKQMQHQQQPPLLPHQSNQTLTNQHLSDSRSQISQPNSLVQQQQSAVQQSQHIQATQSAPVSSLSVQQKSLSQQSHPHQPPSQLAPSAQVPSSQQQQQQDHQQQTQAQPQTQTQNQSLQISNDENPQNSTSSSNSRTPDSGGIFAGANNTFTSSGGLKFNYEPQTNPIIQPISPPDGSSQSALKESPPSSPGSESGLSRKRKRKSTDSKDNVKLFQNGVHATHMLGNQLNPNSSVAQKMTDQLNMEIEAHSIYTQPSTDVGPPLVGIPFPGKPSIRPTAQSNGPTSLNSMLGGAGAASANGNAPQSLEQLLERQWEQGSQFLMEQAQHFDIASLLSCLHQLRTENVRLEEHITNLIARRDHLLAVNARLAIPLNPNIIQNPNSVNTMHLNGPTTDNPIPTGQAAASITSRLPRQNAAHYSAQPQAQQAPSSQSLQAQPPMPIENGIDFRHSSHQTTSNPSNLSRHSSANANYSSSTSSTHNQHSILPSSGRHTSHSGTSSSNVQNSESLIRNRGTSNASGPSLVGNTGGGGGGDSRGGGGSSYHSATQSAYSTVHQSQLRRDDGPGKPS